MQVDPIKSTLKVPGNKRLKLKHDELLSIFAFNFNLRRYNPGSETWPGLLQQQFFTEDAATMDRIVENGRQGLPLVHYSAQLEPFMTKNTP